MEETSVLIEVLKTVKTYLSAADIIKKAKRMFKVKLVRTTVEQLARVLESKGIIESNEMSYTSEWRYKFYNVVEASK
jgi:hypothetical protein